MDKLLLALGSLYALLGVAGGAFGAHALKAKLPAAMLDIFEVGIRYQMYHALALLVLGGLALNYPGGLIRTAGWLMIFGMTIFSGSLYVLALTGIKWWGAITPIGGVILLIAWLLLFIHFIRS